MTALTIAVFAIWAAAAALGYFNLRQHMDRRNRSN